MLTPCTIELEIPIAIRDRAMPVFYSSDLIAYETQSLDPAGILPEDAGEDRSEGGDDDSSVGAGPGGGAGGAGAAPRISGLRGGRLRSRSEDPGEPPLPPDETSERCELASTTGDEPTVRDRLRELEWRHSAGVDDERGKGVGEKVPTMTRKNGGGKP